MKSVSRRDKPIMTWFGGTEGVPMALRNIDKTITIRVKEVARIKTAGASDNTVIRTNNLTPEVTCCGSADCGSIVNETPGAVEHPLIKKVKMRIKTRQKTNLIEGLR